MREGGSGFPLGHAIGPAAPLGPRGGRRELSGQSLGPVGESERVRACGEGGRERAGHRPVRWTEKKEGGSFSIFLFSFSRFPKPFSKGVLNQF